MMFSGGEGLFLHASAVAVDGEAFLFLGHSTAGKSTVARLLGEAYPVVADDSVFAARRPDGRWNVVDGGFRFKEADLPGWQERIRRQIVERPVLLRACLRIHKAPELRIAPMDAVELARHLMDAAMEIDLQRKCGRLAGKSKIEPATWNEGLRMRRLWFAQVAEIARTIPGRHLWFSRTPPLRELCDMLQRLVY